MTQLIDRLSAREVLEHVLAERFQRSAARQPIVTQLAGDRRHQRLPTMSRGEKACHLIERWAEVVAVAQLRGTGMKRHPDANGRQRRPCLALQHLLHGKRRVQREPRRSERRKERVAGGLEHIATVRLYATTQDDIVRMIVSGAAGDDPAPRPQPRLAAG